jgi:chromosome segregation ATPase
VKPVPSIFLLLLILLLCGLCGWQWYRENLLRDLAISQRVSLDTLQSERNELESRVKAADAEVLRLTGAIAELRQNSVSAQEHSDLVASSTKLREDLVKQSEVLKQHAEALTQANASIVQANETVKLLTTERDSLVTKVNEVTMLYNALAAKRQ